MYSFNMIFLSLVAVIPFAFAEVHDITVGGENGELVFVPEAISAQAGDEVVFHFNPKNHTVTQASFDSPCGMKEGGFDSGFVPVTADGTDIPVTFNVTVEDDKPIWVYCKQRTPKSHCGEGMVFAVNCGGDGSANSFANFKAAAIAFGQSLASSSDSAGASQTASAPSATANQTLSAMASVTPVYEVPPAPSVTVVTQVITLTLADAPEPSVWTTTYGSYPGSADATPAAAEGSVIKVVVGGDAGLVFDPPRVDAKPRDIIEFEFRQKNHTVTQSSFDSPCAKISSDAAFDSGFIPVDQNTTEFPKWRLTVNDTTPIWAYCKQKTPASHCEAGMLFAVNSIEDSPRNFSAYMGVAKALAVTGNTTNSTDGGNASEDGSDGAREVLAHITAPLFTVLVAVMLSVLM